MGREKHFVSLKPGYQSVSKLSNSDVTGIWRNLYTKAYSKLTLYQVNNAEHFDLQIIYLGEKRRSSNLSSEMSLIHDCLECQELISDTNFICIIVGMAMKVNANRMCGDIMASVMQKGIDGQTNGQHRSFAYAQRHYNRTHQYSIYLLTDIY